jgi:hypothetical protein
MEQLRGTGQLFFGDGKPFGEVRYEIVHDHGNAQALGSVSGHLQVLRDADRHFPFWDFMQGDSVGLLRLEDGRWWICNLQADGRATNRAGLRDAGPIPKIA